VSVVLGGHDRPEPLERLLGVLRKLDAARLLPFGGEVVGVEDLGAVEGGGDACEVPPAARVAGRELDGLAREVARGHLECRSGLALQYEQALLRSDEKLGHRSTS
jgi:hypothetical protein